MTLEETFQTQAGTQFALVPDERGGYQVRTPFEVGSGDGLVVYLRPDNDGWILTDEGFTLFHIGLWMKDEELYEGIGRMAVNCILADSDVEEREGEFIRRITNDDFGEAFIRFCQALVKVAALAVPNVMRNKLLFRQALANLKEQRREEWNSQPTQE